MDNKTKAELRKKGAIVAWTCQGPYGMCHLFYLKVEQGRFSLVRQTPGQPDIQTNPTGEGYYRLDEKKKAPLLIMALSNWLKGKTLAISKPIYLVDLEKVKVIPGLSRKKLKELK